MLESVDRARTTLLHDRSRSLDGWLIPGWHPDWDLIPVAVDYMDFARLSSADYYDFVAAYGGHDVTSTSAFRVLADIQELRWVVFVLGKAADSVDAARETRHRVACLRGEVPRPWTWTAF